MRNVLVVISSVFLGQLAAFYINAAAGNVFGTPAAGFICGVALVLSIPLAVIEILILDDQEAMKALKKKYP